MSYFLFIPMLGWKCGQHKLINWSQINRMENHPRRKLVYREREILDYSRFSQMHKIDDIGITVIFVFPNICHFLLYLQHVIFVSGKLDISSCGAVYCKVADFIGLVPFQWHSQNKIGNTGIRVLLRVCENLYCAVYSWCHRKRFL